MQPLDPKQTCFNGKCNGDFDCACYLGFYGNQCRNDVCFLVTCETNEHCVPSTIMSDGYECKCQDGYYQTDTGCVDFNTHICRDHCLNGGVCSVVRVFQIRSYAE